MSALDDLEHFDGIIGPGPNGTDSKWYYTASITEPSNCGISILERPRVFCSSNDNYYDGEDWRGAYDLWGRITYYNELPRVIVAPIGEYNKAMEAFYKEVVMACCSRVILTDGIGIAPTRIVTGKLLL